MSKVSENSQAHFGAIGWLAVRVETFKRSLFFEPTSCQAVHCIFNSYGQTLKEASKKKNDAVFLIATKMHPAVFLFSRSGKVLKAPSQGFVVLDTVLSMVKRWQHCNNASRFHLKVEGDLTIDSRSTLCGQAALSIQLASRLGRGTKSLTGLCQDLVEREATNA